MNCIREIYQDLLSAIPTTDRLMTDLAKLSDADTMLCFLCYDILSLRKINRAYGRKVGDALLTSIAEWTFHLQGSLYRIEGDQFCILFETEDVFAVYEHAFALQARFEQPWNLYVDGKEYAIFVQASICVLGDPACNYTLNLLDLLEQGLELAKHEQQVVLFTAEDDQLTQQHIQLQMELKHCVLSDMCGFYLEYQPLVDATSSTWRGLEALCRWESALLGRVSPAIFIDEVEKLGLIHQLGAWVLDEAIRACKETGLDLIEQFFLSVNTSALQMNRHNFANTVIQTLQKHDFPAHKLQLEITESTQFCFNATTTETIALLRNEGVLFALDDFGSGYSGFSNLKNLPVDMLKTDKTFIENIENDTYLQYFYFIMSQTAHANGMCLIAEGVETPEQLTSVVKNGADLIQGYLFGKPMDMQSIAKRISLFHTPSITFNNAMNNLLDFKQWMSSQDAYTITPSLFGLQSQCIGVLPNIADPDEAIQTILQIIGQHFRVSRAYVFLQDEGSVFSNRYEWCADGVAPQKHLFQNMDGHTDRFYDILCENEVVIARTYGELPANLLQRLEDGQQSNSIEAMVVMPIKQYNKILGFVGFDDSCARNWVPEELIILHNLCLFCLIILAKQDTL
ncbi:EAL domain-containing protein [Eubacteriales bacterium OttesenSCG-928-N14]|nr:EAL domain-containing protein [Eubacteriales bacterium OttesenSCG-928-N14]